MLTLPFLRILLSLCVLFAPLSSALPTQDGSRSRRAAVDKIRGVNLGGWFVIEPWMTPSLMSKANKATGVPINLLPDQWSLMKAFGWNKVRAKTFMQQHWSTFIVESDFQQIQQAGLNTVRLPVPHWAFNSSTSEPYLPSAEQPYIKQALLWAKKYNLDVILDMHTAPNSQNGFENSGRQGQTNFRQVDGPTNLARLSSALKTMTQLYVNDAQFKGVVKYIEVLNEPLCSTLGADYMTYVYQQSAQAIQSTVSPTAVFKPQVLLHDCFITPLSNWQGATNAGGGLYNASFTLDTHRYHVFNDRQNKSFQQHIDITHQDGDEIAAAQSALSRPVMTGEFSLAVSCTDCASLANNASTTALLNRQFFATQTTAYERGSGWVFWNWKSENNLPWSYVDAVKANWIPSSPTDKSLAL